MQDYFQMLQIIVPELNELLIQRLQILSELSQQTERIGRKRLADKVAMTERSLRTTLYILRDQNLIDVNSQGVLLTSLGLEILNTIESVFNKKRPFYKKEQLLKQHLNIDYCWIVAGDAETDESIYDQIGKVVQEILIDILDTHNNVIAVTGGSTLAKVGQSFTPDLTENHEVTFVPARGGVGGSFHIQSNSVGGLMSQQTEAKYVPLFIPESIDQRMYEVLLADPSINRAIEMSKQANCLLLSVGTANVMAERRDITKEQKNELIKGKAVGEAFGVFYNREGEEILRLPRLGIQIEDLDHFPKLITIVAGSSKVEAVTAFYKLTQAHGWLVCDEGIANSVLNGLNTH